MHLALVHGNMPSEEMSLEEAHAFVSSVSYVVSWHSMNYGSKRFPKAIDQRVAVPLQHVPVCDVFYAHQRAREQLMESVFALALFVLL